MQNKITTKATSFSFVLLLAIGSVSIESHANESNNKGLFLSHKSDGVLALNSMRGKPPFKNRAAVKRYRKRNQNVVEMSALEVGSGRANKLHSKSYGKGFNGGHPYHSKKYTNRH
jgi:hypothetical protein